MNTLKILEGKCYWYLWEEWIFFKVSLLPHNILKKSEQVYSEFTLVIKTVFRISADSWIFSLIHKRFMKENTRSRQTQKELATNLSTFE
jgi:hypothetical protein